MWLCNRVRFGSRVQRRLLCQSQSSQCALLGWNAQSKPSRLTQNVLTMLPECFLNVRTLLLHGSQLWTHSNGLLFSPLFSSSNPGSTHQEKLEKDANVFAELLVLAF